MIQDSHAREDRGWTSLAVRFGHSGGFDDVDGLI